MIYTQWWGLFDKKGELQDVSETKADAYDVGIMLEMVGNKKPTELRKYDVGEITIIRGNLLDFVMFVINAAQMRIKEAEAERIAAQATQFKKEEPQTPVV